MKRSMVMVGSVGVLAAILALASQGMAQVKQGKSRPLTTKNMMSGLVKPQYVALNTALQGSGPADDAGWTAAISSAELLSESGYMLMEDGRCPDATWAGASKSLQDASATLLTRLKAKDAAGARDTMMLISGSCKACHTAHKK